eukprot:8799993-Prorocentrum_lima.AAC.1
MSAEAGVRNSEPTWDELCGWISKGSKEQQQTTKQKKKENKVLAVACSWHVRAMVGPGSGRQAHPRLGR